MLENALFKSAIMTVNPRTDPLWLRLVSENRSDVFHSPSWMTVLADTYEMDVQALVLVNDKGRPRGGVPYVRVSDFLGERVAVLPFSDYCDPLVDSTVDWAEISGALLSSSPRVSIRCLHNQLPLADKRFSTFKRAKWHAIDLRPDIESHWERIDGSARRAVRKAEKEGVEVRLAESEKELRAFFGLHLGIRKRKYHMLAQPYSFFLNIWRNLIEQGRGFLMLATVGGEVVGGVVFLEWKDTLYYKFNASDPRYLNHRPNDVMIWNGIRLAKERGLARFDFGLSDWDQEELIRYKRKYATEEKTISFLVRGAEAEPAKNAQLRRLFGQLTDLLTDESVPDDVTDRAGEIMYRFFI